MYVFSSYYYYCCVSSRLALGRGSARPRKNVAKIAPRFYQADYTVALNDRAKRIRAPPVHGASFTSPAMASKVVEPTTINPVAPSATNEGLPSVADPSTDGAELGVSAAAPSSSSEIQGRPPLSDFDSLQRGIKVYKWFRGPPVGRHIRQLKISADYTSLVWQSKGQERALKLSEVEKLTKGLSSFSKDVKKASELDMSFTVHTTTSKDLEVTAVKSQDFNILFNVIQFLILNPKEAFNLNNGGRKNLTGPFDVFTWGFGGFGQLAQGDVRDRSTPTRIGGLSLSVSKGIKQIACGLEHVVMLAESTNKNNEIVQTVYGFGNNGSMRLTGKANALAIVDTHQDTIGNGSFNPNYQQPLEATYLACGDYHTLALVNDGNHKDASVYAWGSNMFGQLGMGDDNVFDQGDPKNAMGLLATSSLCLLEECFLAPSPRTGPCTHGVATPKGSWATGTEKIDQSLLK